jgi:hypothetical protein
MLQKKIWNKKFFEETQFTKDEDDLMLLELKC